VEQVHLFVKVKVKQSPMYIVYTEKL